MSFISWEFPILLLLSVILYWRLPWRGRIYLLLAVSYFFYGYWDARFLALILASTVVDFIVTQGMVSRSLSFFHRLGLSLLPAIWLSPWTLGFIEQNSLSINLQVGLAGAGLMFAVISHMLSNSTVSKNRLHMLWLSIVINIGLLALFKYFGFFAESLQSLLSPLGMGQEWVLYEVLLPVGISFYTFQSLSYTIDVYRKKVKPESNFTLFATYIAFFPQLVAGPIERAGHLMPQLAQQREFNPNDMHAGARLILTGLFKKIFVADNCGLLVNYAFQADGPYNIYWALIGAIAFAFQIYGDFSGYTDIARGSARLFGIRLSRNFLYPYIARGPSDFWQRWHISLSSWFRDYVYIPLGGNQQGSWLTLRNLILTMALAGLWHGAAWPFVLWGLYHGALLVAYRSIPMLSYIETSNSLPVRVLAIGFMFCLTLFGWVIFRADEIGYIEQWLTALTVWDATLATDWVKPLRWLGLHVLPLLFMQWLMRKESNEASMWVLPSVLRGFSYFLMILLIVSAASYDQEFIYFQF